MQEKNKETITFAWCDSGLVNGEFTHNLLNTILELQLDGFNIKKSIRVGGINIAKQRSDLINGWYDNIKTDWLVWVDSDISINAESFKKLWNSKNKKNKPVVCGVYFMLKESTSLPQVVASFYLETDNKKVIETFYPIPENELIEIDGSGFGFVLMHKSIVPKMRKILKNNFLFAENKELDDNFVTEDISFFRGLKKCKIKAYAHTGATVEHLKTFPVDSNYFKLYWESIINKTLVKPSYNFK
jgi:hypothetical protein